MISGILLTDEKVQLANQIYDLVDRYLRRLDQELHKFKMELEADNKGITELLEKRKCVIGIIEVHIRNPAVIYLFPEVLLHMSLHILEI